MRTDIIPDLLQRSKTSRPNREDLRILNTKEAQKIGLISIPLTVFGRRPELNLQKSRGHQRKRPEVELFVRQHLNVVASARTVHAVLAVSRYFRLVPHLPRVYSAAESEHIARLPACFATVTVGK